MRCMACGAAMVLMNAVADDTMAVPGFERRAYMCPACGETENRLAFTKDANEHHFAVTPTLPSPDIAPAAITQNQGAAAQSFFGRVLARLLRVHLPNK